MEPPALATTGPRASGAAASSIKAALVKIDTIANPADLLSPWQGTGTEKYIGSGVIVGGNRILTNAHLVADQVSIEVKRQGMTQSYEAHPIHIAHECDLALLGVEDPEFFAGVTALGLGELPRLQDTVDVYGFPIGGDSISITSGIVSRLEIGTYAHSQEELLIAQVDAALNPGNSGGPVVAGSKVVGIAVQTLDGAENVGYMIPAPVVKHFLDDVADGRFDGFPNLGVDWQPVENKALRTALGLEKGETGALINRVSSGATADGMLLPGDVLLSIDKTDIAEDLTISLDGHGRISAAYAVQRRQAGDEVEVRVARGGRRIIQSVLLKNTPLLVPGPQYDRKPTYLVFAGLVFQTVTLDLVETLSDWQFDLGYYAYTQYQRTPERSQVVLLSKVLAAPINRGHHDWENLIVHSIEGVVPRDMTHVASLIDGATGPWLEITTETGQRLTLDLEEARAAHGAILERYGVPKDRSPDLVPPH